MKMQVSLAHEYASSFINGMQVLLAYNFDPGATAVHAICPLNQT